MSTTEPPVAAWRELLATTAGARRWQQAVVAANAELNAFTEVDAGRDAGSAANAAPGTGALAGVPFAVKDNIAVRGFSLSCGSALLRSLVAPYTATAVARLQAAGARVVGKTNLDEFGMGSSSENSCFGAVRNPWRRDLVAGGSSGGSAAVVAAGMVPFALGSDTGGSVRQPASFCGVYGLKPTYGAVSRFGLVAYASSLDVVGIAAADVATTRAVFEVIRGVDGLDQSSVDYPEPPPPGAVDSLVVGVPDGVLEGVDPAVRAAVLATRERLESLGTRCVPVALGSLEHVVPAYYVIATAEASANLARYDGVRYGARGDAQAMDAEELTVATRSAGFGAEVKLRILIGTYVLRSGFQEQYYQRAQRVRTLIRRAFEHAFQEVDLLLLPTFPVPPFAIGDAGLDAFQQKQGDLFTCAANLTGLPALALPSAVHGGLPIGAQLMAPHFREDLLFQVASPLEAQYPAPRAPGCLDPATLGGCRIGASAADPTGLRTARRGWAESDAAGGGFGALAEAAG